MKKRTIWLSAVLLAAILLFTTACAGTPSDNPDTPSDNPAPGVAGSYQAALNSGNYAAAYAALMADTKMEGREAELKKFVALPVKLVAEKDPLNGDYTAEFTYDEKGQLQKVTAGFDYSPDEWTFTYTEDGKLLVTTFKDGDDLETTTNTYDENGRLVKTVVEDGERETRSVVYVYEDDGKKMTETIKKWDVYQDEYIVESFVSVFDAKGQLLSYTDEDGRVRRQYTYDDNGNILTETETDLSSGTNTYTYDDQNRLIKKRWDDLESDYWSETVYGYDACGGRLTTSYESQEDGKDKYVYDHEFDENGHMITQIYKDTERNNRKITSFDTAGNAIRIVAEKNGEVTEIYDFTYDQFKNRTGEKYENKISAKSYAFTVEYEMMYFEGGAPQPAEFLKGLNEESTLRYVFS